MKQLNTLFSALSARPLMLLFLLVFLPISVYSVTVSTTKLTLKVGGEDGVIEVIPEGTDFYIDCTQQSDDGGQTWYPVYSRYVDVAIEGSKVIVHPKAYGSTGFYIVCNGYGSFYISINILSENSFTALTEEGVEMTFNVSNETTKQCKAAASCIDPETTGKVTVPSYPNGYKVVGFDFKSFQN